MDGVALLPAALVGAAVGGGIVAAAVRRRPEPAEGSARQRVGVSVDPLVLQALPAGLALVGDGDEVLLANDSARRLGVVRGQELGSARVAALLRDARRGRAVEGAEVREDGQAWGVTARQLSGGVAVVVVEDRTERLRVEEVRRDFVANVGHELKTPVGALALLAEATGDAADDPGAVRRFAGRMSHETARLTRLVQDVIDLSRLQGDVVARREPVDLDRVVDEAVDRTRELAAAKGIEIHAGGERRVMVSGDERQLVTATANLLHNAVAYSPSGTHVAVAVTRTPGHAEIAVRDQGIGVPPAEQARIFERFYRVDPARSRETGGTGLGLAIVKHVATGHGGGVRVWSREGEGSTFTLSLPLHAGPPPQPTPPDRERTVLP